MQKQAASRRIILGNFYICKKVVFKSASSRLLTFHYQRDIAQRTGGIKILLKFNLNASETILKKENRFLYFLLTILFHQSCPTQFPLSFYNFWTAQTHRNKNPWRKQSKIIWKLDSAISWNKLFL